ncbi:hypothetical protein UCREL1_10130 [Eutypa lata UCREL1]|uniref:Uncharacterized protein n=1 Tax=Eutypa lata (strain UCR-EL1) TaxID=1287681 RepID=M7SZB8_EUTLA|nr:hypothetical protein UCREL1_10130 [Eutypa lata UCREL1]
MADSTQSNAAATTPTPAPAEHAGGKWTDAEKYTLMVQIIKQLTAGGIKIKLSELSMPGRTTKSLSHMLGKIRDEAAAFNPAVGNGSGGSAAAAAATVATPVTPKNARGAEIKKAATASGK